jgi:hypothetical protein
MTTRTHIPEKAIEKVRNKIASATSPKRYIKTEIEVVRSLNSILRGWGNYYKYASNAGTVFRRIQDYAFWGYAHFIGRKHRRKHMSSILKPLTKGGRGIIGGSRKNPVKTLCGIGHKGKKIQVVKLFIMSNIQDRKLKPIFKKPNPYLKESKP